MLPIDGSSSGNDNNPNPPTPTVASAATTAAQAAAANAAAAAAANAVPLEAPPETALRRALTHEQELRKAAEVQAARKDSEVEELTAQLFEQANNMVATERRARAKLESRIEVLEKRDNDKAKRLGVLEIRVQRAERVRALLSPKSAGINGDESSGSTEVERS